MIWTIYIRCSNIGIAISISVVRSNATWRITCKLWVWCWINYWAYNVEFTTAGTICSLAIGNIVIGSRFIPSIVKLIIAAILFLSFILKNLLCQSITWFNALSKRGQKSRCSNGINKKKRVSGKQESTIVKRQKNISGP